TEIPVWSRTQTRVFCLPRGLRPSYSSSCQRDTDRNTGTESEDRARKVQSPPDPQKDPARTAPRGRSSNGLGSGHGRDKRSSGPCSEREDPTGERTDGKPAPRITTDTSKTFRRESPTSAGDSPPRPLG